MLKRLASRVIRSMCKCSTPLLSVRQIYSSIICIRSSLDRPRLSRLVVCLFPRAPIKFARRAQRVQRGRGRSDIRFRKPAAVLYREIAAPHREVARRSGARSFIQIRSGMLQKSSGQPGQVGLKEFQELQPIWPQPAVSRGENLQPATSEPALHTAPMVSSRVIKSDG